MLFTNFMRVSLKVFLYFSTYKFVECDRSSSKYRSKGEDALNNSTVTISMKKFCSGYKNHDQSLVWFGLALWHINLCRLFNVKSIFIHINISNSNNSV